MSIDEKKCDIAIIGGGPAGLAAGLYAARGGAQTVIFERQVCGGQITTTDWVENYPAFPDGVSGGDLGELLTRQAENHGAAIELFVTVTELVRKTDENDGTSYFRLTTDSGDVWQVRAVILATGAVPRKLNIKGEADYTGRGVSWCATCDAAFYRDKQVAVIGGGDAAVEEALFLTKFARKVYLVHRRDEFRATKVIVDRARACAQVSFVLSHVPLAVEGDGSKVTGLRVRSVINEQEQTLPVDGIFEFVGVDPMNELVGDLARLTDGGYLSTASDGSVTDVPGLFAAGDLTQGTLKQVVTAAAGGAIAAFTALRHLETQ